MTKLVYLAAMALLGLGLTMAQSSTPASDSSNSSKPTQVQNGTAPSGDKASTTSKTPAHHGRQTSKPEEKLPDPTVRDQQHSTTSTTGASDEGNGVPSNSNMGTTGSNPEPEATPPPRPSGEQPSGESTDQQPNSSSNPSPHSMAMNSTPAARATATHSPDPGTCMNPAAMDTNASGTSGPPRNPNCD